VLRALGSFHLSVSIFACMFVVVLVGTLQQRTMSLYDVQRTYFESVVFTVKLFGVVPLPLPGGATLIVALAVNLLVGGVLRMRLGASTAGLLVAHLGILVLFVGSAVEWRASEKGAVRLREGAAASEFESYTDWELAIVDLAVRKRSVVPQDDLGLRRGRARRDVHVGGAAVRRGRLVVAAERRRPPVARARDRRGGHRAGAAAAGPEAGRGRRRGVLRGRPSARRRRRVEGRPLGARGRAVHGRGGRRGVRVRAAPTLVGPAVHGAPRPRCPRAPARRSRASTRRT
jgi:hypothetical protein